MQIEYVGTKPSRTDTVAGTGIVWNGQGDVKDVPDAVAGKLLYHTDIWRRADAKPANPAVGLQNAAGGKKDGESNPTLPVVTAEELAAIESDEALHALAKQRGVKVHPNAKGPKIREAILEAQAELAKA